MRVIDGRRWARPSGGVCEKIELAHIIRNARQPGFFGICKVVKCNWHNCPFSSVVERGTCNAEVTRSNRVGGNHMFLFGDMYVVRHHTLEVCDEPLRSLSLSLSRSLSLSLPGAGTSHMR